jgi:SAM-dependent methyltransferase
MTGASPREMSERSLRTWETVAGGWEEQRKVIADAGQPVADALLAAVAPKPGDTILELACGNGDLAAALAPMLGTGGRVIAADFAPTMVDVARRAGSQSSSGNIEYLVLNAEEMTLPDGSVDGVVCRWGYMLMPRAAKALAETRRVLRAGGRLACAVFGDAARNPWAALPAGVLVAHGCMTPSAPGAPGLFALHDADVLRRMVADAGFSSVDIHEVPHAWRFPDADAYWLFLTRAAGGMAMAIGRLDDAARAAVRRDIEGALPEYRTDRGIVLPALSLCVLAR